jgi:Mg2+ and Co2+ transporter CorA
VCRPFAAGIREYFRDLYDHLQRLNQSADAIRDTVATAISVNLSMVTLQESETMKRLAAYAALVALVVDHNFLQPATGSAHFQCNNSR